MFLVVVVVVVVVGVGDDADGVVCVMCVFEKQVDNVL